MFIALKGFQQEHHSIPNGTLYNQYNITWCLNVVQWSGNVGK